MTSDFKQRMARAAGAVAILFLLPIACGNASTAAPAQSPAAEKLEDTLRVGWFPGLTSKPFRQVAAGFEKATGVKVTVVEEFDNPRLAKFKADPGYLDLAPMTGANVPAYRAAGLTTPLSESRLPRLHDVPARLRGTDYFVAQVMSWGIAYNPDKVKPAPTSWNDLLNPTYKGHVTSPDIAFNGSLLTLVALARLGGGDQRHLDPGFERMQQLRANSPTFWSSDSVMLQMLEQGSVWMSPYFSGSTWQAAEQPGAAPLRFVVPKEGGIENDADLFIPAASHSPKAANAFANYLLDPKVQQTWAAQTYSTPSSSRVTLGPQYKDKVTPVNDLASLEQIDWTAMAAVRPQIVQRWQATIH